MNNKYKKWTISEVQYLIDQVKKDPRNLSAAFTSVAIHLGRTRSAVAAKYYSVTKESNKANTCFTLTSQHYVSCNRKQFTESSTKKTPKDLFKRLIKAIFG